MRLDSRFQRIGVVDLRYVCFDVVERGFRVCKRSRNVRNGLSSAYRRNSAVVSRLQRLKRRFVIISLVERVEILFKLVFRSALCGFQLLRVRFHGCHSGYCRLLGGIHRACSLARVDSRQAVVVSLFQNAPIDCVVALRIFGFFRSKLGLGGCFGFGKQSCVVFDRCHCCYCRLARFCGGVGLGRCFDCGKSVLFGFDKSSPIVNGIILLVVCGKRLVDSLFGGCFCVRKDLSVGLDCRHFGNCRFKRGFYRVDCPCAADCAQPRVVFFCEQLVIRIGIIRSLVLCILTVQLVGCRGFGFGKQSRVVFDRSHRIRRLLQSGVHRLDCSGSIDFGFAVVVSLFKNAPIGCIVVLRIFGFCSIQRCQRGCFCVGKQGCVVFDRRHSGYCRLLCRVDCGNARRSLNFSKSPVVSYCQLRPICGGVVVLVVSIESRLDCSFCFRFCLC